LTNPTPAAQTVGRAVQLLRLVASSQSRNLRLIDIAQMAALDKSTAHRLLQRLVKERMLVRDPGQRGYRLGPLLHELGLAALPEYDMRETAEPALRLLAHATGDMAFLLVRGGFDTVCLNRVAGNFEIQTMTRNIGDRHPLGVGAGGLALLAALCDGDVEAVIRAIAPQLPRYHLDPDALLERVRQTRARGYALDEGTAALDITALGMAIRDRARTPIAAVFVASISTRMVETRKRNVQRVLGECVRAIEAALMR
jgi:DNA-binding IclR family transcriptional regulator